MGKGCWMPDRDELADSPGPVEIAPLPDTP